MRPATTGAALAGVTTIVWGGQFVVGKSALGAVDPFTLTAVRYAIVAALLLLLLAGVEGRQAFRLEGRGWRLFVLGTIGFAGFNLLAYTGLEHAQPQSAALIMTLGPLLTALVLWVKTHVRPATSTIVTLAVALFGVMLVIGRGDPAAVLTGAVGWGDALVFAGALSFVVYTLGAAEFRHLSPLRYTALTAGFGWLSIAAATAVAVGTGLEPVASASTFAGIWPQLAYISVLGAFVALLAWNSAVLRIGPQNATLFGTLIPVTAFAIQIVRGYRPGALELAGAALAIGALVGHDLWTRRRAVAPRQRRVVTELAEAA
jgi:drug/metabolite transporter (DMT)-like permease